MRMSGLQWPPPPQGTPAGTPAPLSSSRVWPLRSASRGCRRRSDTALCSWDSGADRAPLVPPWCGTSDTPGFRAVLWRSPAHGSTVAPMILRRLYLYLVSAAGLGLLAAGLALLGSTALVFIFNAPYSSDSSYRTQLAIYTAMTLVALPVWGIHFWFARRFAMRAPNERASAIRRLYLYWAAAGGALGCGYGGDAAALVIAGLVVWGFHALAIAQNHVADDRHATLRALQGFVAVAVSIGTALFGASQILYYALAKGLGVDHPGGAGNDFLAAAATPGSLLLVYGTAWFLVRRRLPRDARAQEGERQAGLRRLYTNLVSLVALG